MRNIKLLPLALLGALLLSCDRSDNSTGMSEAETFALAPRILAPGGVALPEVDSVRIAVLNANSPNAAPYYEKSIPWSAHGDTIEGIPQNSKILVRIQGVAIQPDSTSAIWWSGSASETFSGVRKMDARALPVPVRLGDTLAPVLLGRAGDSIENTDSIVRLSWKVREDSVFAALVAGDTAEIAGDSAVWERSWKTGRTMLVVASFRDNTGNLVLDTAVVVRKDRVARPAFSHPSGSYDDTVRVAISDSTPGATILYSLDSARTWIAYDTALLLGRDARILAVATHTGMTASEFAIAAYSVQAASPVFSVATGTASADPLAVKLSTRTSGAGIEWSLDTGRTWRAYKDSIFVGRKVHIVARTVKTRLATSLSASADYVVAISPIVSQLPSGGYANYQTDSLQLAAPATKGAQIRYTTDGSDPTSKSLLYSAPLKIDTSCVVKARSFKAGMDSSAVVSSIYALAVQAPTLSIPSIRSSYDLATIRFTSATGGATFQYSLDSVSWKTGDSVVLGKATSLWVRATKKGMASSSVVKGGYGFEISAPVIGLGSGSYNNYRKVALSLSVPATPGAQIRYTKDGSDPTSKSLLYTDSVLIDTSCTLKARTFKSGMDSSAVVSASYSLVVAKPLLSTAYATASTDPIAVRFFGATAGAMVEYSLDSASWKSADSVVLGKSTSLWVRAAKKGMEPSAVAKGTYTFAIPFPMIVLASGTFSDYRKVALTSSNPAIPGVQIRYTKDGSDPTSKSPLYTDSVLIDTSCTLKARTFKSGMDSSAVVSVSYILAVGMPILSTASSTSSYELVAVRFYSATSGAVFQYSLDSASWTNADSVVLGKSTSLWVRAAKKGMATSSVTKGTYSFAIPFPMIVLASGTFSDYRKVALKSSNPTIPGVQIRYTKDGSDPTSKSPLYTDSVLIDTSCTLKARTFKSGMDSSAVVSASYTLVASTPEMSIGGKIVDRCQSNDVIGLTLSSATPGAGFDVSLDTGRTWHPYSDSVTVLETGIVKARTLKQGVNASAEASLTCSVNLPSPTFNVHGEGTTTGIINDFLTLEMSVPIPGAGILYSTDSVDWKEWKDSLVIGQTATVWARISKAGIMGPIKKSAWVVQASDPTFSIGSSSYVYSSSDLVAVKLASATPHAQFEYSLDNGASWIAYKDSILLGRDTQLEARTVKPGLTSSPVSSASYQIDVSLVWADSAPVPQNGWYGDIVVAHVSSLTPGATIQYSTDGVVWNDCGDMINIGTQETLNIRAFKKGMDTTFRSRSYNVMATPPQMSAKSYNSNDLLTVRLINAAKNPEFEYSLDSMKTWLPYEDSIVLNRSLRLYARTVKPGLAMSNTSDAIFAIEIDPPSFPIPSGLYSSPLSVPLSSATPGASVYYTLDGSRPTTSSTRYVAPIELPLNSSTVVTAISTKDGLLQSSAVGAAYVIESGNGSASQVPWNSSVSYESILDARDNRSYKAVTIGSQTWMAQNLEFGGSAAKPDSVGACKGGDPDSCGKYGRLYTWAEAMGVGSGFNNVNASITPPVHGICPEGWHLPSQSEWSVLQSNEGGLNTAGKALNARNGWPVTTRDSFLVVGIDIDTVKFLVNGNGTDEKGFRVLSGAYGGFSISGGACRSFGDAYYWSSTGYSADAAWGVQFDINACTEAIYGTKTQKRSVRCVKDSP